MQVQVTKKKTKISGMTENSYCAKLDAEIARCFGIDETDVCCDYIPRRGQCEPMVLVSCVTLSRPVRVRSWGLLHALRECSGKGEALQVLLDRLIGGPDGK